MKWTKQIVYILVRRRMKIGKKGAKMKRFLKIWIKKYAKREYKKSPQGLKTPDIVDRHFQKKCTISLWVQ